MATEAAGPSSFEGTSAASPPPPTSHASQVSFVVTGFGPFRNVTENPTMVLVRDLLLPHLRQHAPHIRVVATRILETSAEAARAELTDLYRCYCDEASGNQKVVFLHLGVNVFGTKFHLEQCAYNDASFRVPDERSYQPLRSTIEPTAKLGAQLSTTLPLELICDDMRERLRLDTIDSSDTSVVVSTDPGRFVCNYTYYMSLNHCQTRNHMEQNGICHKSNYDNTAHCYALFLHVPSFDVVPQNRQEEVVMQLMKSIDHSFLKTLDEVSILQSANPTHQKTALN